MKRLTQWLQLVCYISFDIFNVYACCDIWLTFYYRSKKHQEVKCSLQIQLKSHNFKLTQVIMRSERQSWAYLWNIEFLFILVAVAQQWCVDTVRDQHCLTSVGNSVIQTWYTWLLEYYFKYTIIQVSMYTDLDRNSNWQIMDSIQLI